MTTYTQSQGMPYGQQPPPPQYGQQPMYAQPQPTIMVSQPAAPVFVGGCPTCQAGVLNEEFTVCGLIWAICCFPIGLLCLFMLREKRCSNCGSTFG